VLRSVVAGHPNALMFDTSSFKKRNGAYSFAETNHEQPWHRQGGQAGQYRMR
jgi:hypothetical protein